MVLAPQVAEHGFAVIPNVIGDDDVQVLEQRLAELESSSRGGIRNLLHSPAICAFAGSPALRRLVDSVLGAAAVAVKGTLFDKTGAANWMVPWRQDLAIAVRERREAEGYGAWSAKDGVPHVLPPPRVLEQMLAVRVHLDDCSAANGPVRVIPGSHRFGRLADRRIEELRESVAEVVCEVARGGALLMRPLLLHASWKAEQPGHRRVVHIEYAAGDLPGGIEWAFRIPAALH